MNAITLEITLKSACDWLKLACEARGVPLDFVSAGITSWHKTMPFQVTLHLKRRNTPLGICDTFRGETFAEALQKAMDAVCAAGNTEKQLADVLGIEMGGED